MKTVRVDVAVCALLGATFAAAGIPGAPLPPPPQPASNNELIPALQIAAPKRVTIESFCERRGPESTRAHPDKALQREGTPAHIVAIGRNGPRLQPVCGRS
ncbi:MAG: hypothetical protein NVS3B28_08290 [Candidatus Velthaea sp.]